jgi:hypothetical protein
VADKKDIAKVVGIISAAYPNFTPNEYTVETYYQTLKDLPTDLLMASTLHSVAEAGRRFAPSIGEIRGAARELLGEASGVPSSYEAWEEVLHQVNVNGGQFGVPVWSHPFVASTVGVLGWRNLCLSENQVADRARFIEAYEQICNRAENRQMMLPQVKEFVERRALEAGNTPKQIAEVIGHLKGAK